MNWTEGALSRHSRRKGWNEEAARQKQYFAKARTQPHHDSAPKLTSSSAAKFVPSYIPKSPTVSSQTSTSSRSRQMKNKPTASTTLGSLNDSENIPGYDGSGSSMLFRLGKRDRSSISERQSSESHEAHDLEAKRQRLLQKRDWTGVGLQKPPVLDLSWKKEKPTVVQSTAEQQPRSRKSSHRDKRSSASLQKKHGNGYEKQSIPPPLTDSMRIRVGNQDFHWSLASNSVRSPTSNIGGQTTLRDWESRNKTPPLPRAPSCTTCASSTSFLSSNGKSARPSPVVSRLFLERSCQKHLPGDRILKKYSTDKNMNLRKLGNTDSARYVILSSPRMLHHPTPTRGELLPLLRLWSPGPESTGSTVAQASDAASPDTHTRINDEKWRDWLHACEEPVVQSRESRGRNSLKTTSISAGSRALRPRDYGIRPTMSSSYIVVSESTAEGGTNSTTNDKESRHKNDFPGSSTALPLVLTPITDLSMIPTSTLESHNFSETHHIRSKDHRITQSIPKVVSDIPVMDKPPEDIDGPLSSIRNVPKSRDLVDLIEVGEQERASRDIPTELQSDTSAEVDEDEIWKKFVFDEDAAEIRQRAFEEAQEQTRRQLLPPQAHLPSDVTEPPSVSHKHLIVTTSPVLRVDYCSECENPGAAAISDDTPNTTTAALEEIMSSATASSSAAVHVAHPASPSPNKRRDADFRFRQPHQFVGRLAHSTTAASDGTQELLRAELPTRGRGRGQRRRRDSGRPDIRSVPNFDGDPIEESP